jgi:ferric-dicitrate binding protein FerR (iron transport regulator)
MDCRQFESDVAEFILSDPCLSTADREEIQRHMGTCSACCEVYTETQWIITLIRDNEERVRRLICCGKDEELPNVSEKPKEAESLVDVEPATEPLEMVEAAWQRLKAGFKAMEEEKRPAVRARRMLLVRWSAAIAASLLVACGLGFLGVRTFSPSGPVMLTSENGAKTIPFGQEIRTGSLSKTLRLGGRHTVVANAGTAFMLTPLHHWLKTGYLVTLETGELYAEVMHDGNPFGVKTPAAEAVITGTKFDIRSQRGQTDLTLVEGSVRLVGDGEAVVVRTGQMSTVADGQAPSAPKPVDVLAATTWARKKMVENALARRNLTADNAMLNYIADSLPSPAPVDPARLDYATWRDAHQQWFAEQFPWIFKAQAVLKTEHNIQADYVELLMVSGDIWQFHYPRSYAQPIPVFGPAAIDRLAKHYGIAPDNLILAVKPAVQASSESTRESARMTADHETGMFSACRRALQQWRTDIATAERQGDGSLTGDLLLFSLGACQYLANTRTAAYLWVREHPEQAARMLADPTCAPAIAGVLSMRRALDSQELTASLRKQAVCVGKAENLGIEQLVKIPKPEQDPCRYGWREPGADKDLSKLLLPSVE